MRPWGPGLLLAAGVLSAAPGWAADAPGPEWCEGPAGYLATRSQCRHYRRLSTPAERAQFVEDFWLALDPDPATSRNEYRERFDRLCDLAQERFSEDGKPGWRTDRGRVLITFGAPHEIRREPGPPARPEREVWVYDAGPGQRAPTEIVFRKTRKGRFRELPDVPTVPLEIPDRRALERERRRLYQELRWIHPDGSSADILALVETLLPEPEPSLLGPSRTGPPGPPSVQRYSTRLPVPNEPDLREESFFFRASDGSVLTLLACEVYSGPEEPVEGGPAERDGTSRPVVWAAATPAGGRSEEQNPVRAVRLQASSVSQDPLLLGGHVFLEPGVYRLSYAIRRASGLVVRVRSRELRVPKVGGEGFSASSVVPARRFGPARSNAPTPFSVGSEEVIPRPGATFHPGEPLRLYLQIYGAATSPETGHPRVDVRFRFRRAGFHWFGRHGESVEVRSLEDASVGLTLPLDDWPAGDYRVIVHLRDRVSGARASTRGTFRIAGD